MSRKILLNAFMMYTPMMHAIGSWALPENRTAAEFSNAEFWQDIAHTLERGCFELVFFGDHLAPYDVYRNDASISIKYGLQFPVHDPLSLVPWMAAATKHLGFGVTLSTAFYQPYLLTRKLSTLDHLSKGRMAWNVVTSAQENESRNMGLGEMLPHDERYDRADEYMDVVNQLWSSWAPDAMVCDQERLVLSNPDKVRSVEHEGKYFSIHAPASVSASPQGRPLIMQAGGSPRGRDFSALHAEMVFAIKRTPADMRDFEEDMTRRASGFGRERQDFKIIYGVQVIQGATAEEASRKREALVEKAALEPSLAKLSGLIGVDLDGIDPDGPIQDVKVPGAQGLLDIFTKTRGEPLTVRQALSEYGASGGCLQVVGTAESVADQLEELFVDGGADGFNMTPPYLPGAYEEFVSDVVPLLRERGLLHYEYPPGTLRERIFNQP